MLTFNQFCRLQESDGIKKIKKVKNKKTGNGTWAVNAADSALNTQDGQKKDTGMESSIAYSQYGYDFADSPMINC